MALISTFLSPQDINLLSDNTADALGGKGYSLISMMKDGIRVPPGLILPTAACHSYEAQGDEFMKTVMTEVMAKVKKIAETLGQPHVLFSVRSGAPISMPGMMDTILNVGLTPDAMPYWEEKLGKRAARDCLRRLIQMMGATAFGIPSELFEAQLAIVKKEERVEVDSQISEGGLQSLISRYLTVFVEKTSKPFPSTLKDQLRAAIEAVFRSWNNERAKTYRKMNNIPETMGTAVVIQAMVFGNLDDDSGSGVAFTREPTTGENKLIGEFLVNAQGEDVVSGIRTPMPLSEMQAKWPSLYTELRGIGLKLEKLYFDMMDLEFTVQSGVLYLLQCRPGKRAALASVRIAYEMLAAGVIFPGTARKRVKRHEIKLLMQKRIDDSFDVLPSFTGIGATIGVVSGRAVLTAQDAINCKEATILVRHETDPDDIGGMAAATGILTQHGGSTSHAAVCARSMNKACIVGCSSLPDDLSELEGKTITMDALTGKVWVDIDVPLVGGTIEPSLFKLAKSVIEFSDNVPFAFSEAGEFGGTFRLVEYLAADTDSKQAMLQKLGVYNYQLVDLRTHVQNPNDGLLEDLFACIPEQKVAKSAVPEEVWAVMKTKLGYLTVLADGPDAAKARDLSCKVVSLPETFKELVEKKAKVAAPSLVKQVGGYAVFKGLVEDFKPKTDAEVLPVIRPWQTALFEALEA